MAFSKGEALGVSPDLDFQAAIGSKSPNQGMKTFDNNLFTLELGFHGVDAPHSA